MCTHRKCKQRTVRVTWQVGKQPENQAFLFIMRGLGKNWKNFIGYKNVSHLF